jgi:hypothetical protein
VDTPTQELPQDSAAMLESLRETLTKHQDTLARAEGMYHQQNGLCRILRASIGPRPDQEQFLERLWHSVMLVRKWVWQTEKAIVTITSEIARRTGEEHPRITLEGVRRALEAPKAGGPSAINRLMFARWLADNQRIGEELPANT